MERQSERYMNPAGKPTQDNFLQSILSWILESGTRLKSFQVVRNGLVPMSGKVSIDNFIYMTPGLSYGNRLL